MQYKDTFYLYTYSYRFGVFTHKSWPFKFRFDPIPNTGGRCPWRPGIRHMKTTQERRISCDPDHKKYVRGSRNYIGLPNSWDDFWHARKTKGWKRTKKKRQWMKKGDKLYEKIDWQSLLVD